MATPTFSVICCTFNRAHLLPRALASLRAQSFRDWEALVVDDGSTDDTATRLRALAHDDRRVRVIRTPHGGLPRARNTGIDAARGRFVTFLDSDDAYAPDHLALRASAIAARPTIDLVHGGLRVVGDPFVADRHNPTVRIPIADCVVGGTFVVRRTLFRRIGRFPAVPYGDDAAFFDRARAGGAAIAHVTWPSYIYYRGEPDSLCILMARA